MRMASTACILLGSICVALALPMPAGMLERTPAMAALYAAQPSALVDYVAAMRRNAAQSVGGSQPENPFHPQGQPGAREPWTWTAANGDMVVRLREGVFVIRHGDYVANWFTDLECSILEWPAFQCADGQTLTMSAPNPDTVIFGGIEYRR